MVYEYTTPSKVQSELRASTAFATDTSPSLSDVSEWIQEESEQLNEDSATNWGSTSYTEYITFDKLGYDLTLKHSPIINVISVEYNSSPDGTVANWTTKTADIDYIIYPEEGMIRIVPSLWSPKTNSRGIRVTYVAGYSTTPLRVQKYITKAVTLRVLDTLIAQNVEERNDGGSISVGNINIVEPSSYGVASYKQLRDEVTSLRNTLAGDGFKVYRYGN